MVLQSKSTGLQQGIQQGIQLFSKARSEDSETRQHSRLHLHILSSAESETNLMSYSSVPTTYILVKKCL